MDEEGNHRFDEMKEVEAIFHKAPNGGGGWKVTCGLSEETLESDDRYDAVVDIAVGRSIPAEDVSCRDEELLVGGHADQAGRLPGVPSLLVIKDVHIGAFACSYWK